MTRVEVNASSKDALALLANLRDAVLAEDPTDCIAYEILDNAYLHVWRTSWVAT